ncbi:hypothetical protein HYS00_03355 [Candidatus Microgenomates bacterium]|nr:hypothetical protein [Candidatus Microgenomates bacterium]
MKAFSYTKTPYLLEQIEKTEDLRRTLLLTPLSLKDSSFFRWKALVDRIHYSFLLKGTMRDKKTIEDLLQPHSLTHVTSIQKEMLRFKKTLDSVYYHWLVTNDAITLGTLQDVYNELYGEKFRIDDKELHYNLRYIQTNPDNPLIQAGLAYLIFLSHAEIGKEGALLSFIVPLMFLYKAGYDYRQFLVLEEYQLNKLLKNISSKDFNMDSSHTLLDLNERQKAILSSLDEPGSKISNKLIQKTYRISAITAARDLAKLSNLGYLFPIGKGRSTYYTKV